MMENGEPSVILSGLIMMPGLFVDNLVILMVWHSLIRSMVLVQALLGYIMYDVMVVKSRYGHVQIVVSMLVIHHAGIISMMLVFTALREVGKHWFILFAQKWKPTYV